MPGANKNIHLNFIMCKSVTSFKKKVNDDMVLDDVGYYLIPLHSLHVHLGHDIFSVLLECHHLWQHFYGSNRWQRCQQKLTRRTKKNQQKKLPSVGIESTTSLMSTLMPC